jgi:hypothetical protein
LATLTVLSGVVRSPALAAGTPSGTISCSIVAGADPNESQGIKFRPFITGDPLRTVGVRVKNNHSACDNSNVVGGNGPITEIAFQFVGSLPDGSCASLTSTPQFSKGLVKVRWRGLNPAGRPRTLAVSKATLASASFDGGSAALILTTQPISKGAFLGGVITAHLGFDMDVTDFNTFCSGGAKFVSMPYGAINPSTLDVQ